MDLAALIQAVVVALCTWYIRRGNKNDKADSDENHKEIIRRLDGMDNDMCLVKAAIVDQNELLKNCPIQKQKKNREYRFERSGSSAPCDVREQLIQA